MDAIFYFFLDILMSSRYIVKNNSCSRRPNRHCQFGIFTIQVWIKLLEIIVLLILTDFVQEELLDLPYWIVISVICVLEDVSRRLDILTSEFSVILEYLRVLSGFFADTASEACPSKSVNFAIICMIFVAVIWDVDDLYSVNTAQASESSFLMLSRSSARPLDFWIFDSNSVFFKWHLFIIEVKWTFLLCLCVSRMFSFLLPISHGLTDTFISISFFPVNDSFVSWLQIPGSYRMRMHTCFRNIVSLSLSKALSVGIKHRRNRASFWLTTAASGFLIRDLLWNTQWCFFLVITHLLEDRRGICLVIETDIELIICVWDAVDQSDSPLNRATVGIRLDTRTNEKENKEEGDVKQKDEKARSSISGVTWQRG